MVRLEVWILLRWGMPLLGSTTGSCHPIAALDKCRSLGHGGEGERPVTAGARGNPEPVGGMALGVWFRTTTRRAETMRRRQQQQQQEEQEQEGGGETTSPRASNENGGGRATLVEHARGHVAASSDFNICEQGIGSGLLPSAMSIVLPEPSRAWWRRVAIVSYQAICCCP
ncbi:hypothetical protein AXG93_3483s1130 [Marchantia polymorpha subsp. ruderalis]|uniref:Secreted protein n=1 Tax=Marchantia polymorpha subsp. ruderalis TaxID=1480154 RepID=A0A176WCR2_MARPO|nr:hypothetical protein AXG93_3483s1130 [Marchantia polymorpha subsp. ruderalis]